MKKIRKWKKEFPRIFAAALAAVLLATMPGTASVAVAEETTLTDGNPETETAAEQTGNDADPAETETDVLQEPAEEDGDENIPETENGDTTETEGEKPEEEVAPPKEDEKSCDCGILCTEDSINGDCPVCGAEGADLSACRGEEKDNDMSDADSGTEDDAGSGKCICELLCTEESINNDCPICGVEGTDLSVCEGTALTGNETDEENTEVIETEDVETEDTSLCAHHKEHTEECGYVPVSEDGEGSPCAYECRICPIEELIAVLPDKVTEDNEKEVRAQLDKILALYGKLTEEEQEQVDLSRCLELQEALDAANALMLADGHDTKQTDDAASVTIGETTTYYTTLEEAFSAANRKTATITMLADAECTSDSGSPLNITGGTVTLDMGGQTLSGSGYGYYGIICVSGGSLTVRGTGTVQVSAIGMSCSKGTLTVQDTQFTLVGGLAEYAIYNSGGSITLNSGTIITGTHNASSQGQVFHQQGHTTINDLTATDSGTTSVFFGSGPSSSVLTINGGTFGKIVTDNAAVSTLLGSRMTYRHTEAAGGAWATEGELAKKSIENVTVQKIPLTINPQAETSWYYGSGERSLTMNATPATAGDAVTYEWSDRTNPLDCAADAYPIPENLDVGSYTYTCKATCDGYTLSHDFVFEIKKSGTEFTGDGVAKAYLDNTEQDTFAPDNIITVIATPTATGQAPANTAMMVASLDEPTGGQMALFVDDTQVSRPESANSDGSYTMTVLAGNLLRDGYAQPGQPFTLTSKFVENDNMAAAECPVTITINAIAKVTMPNGNSTTTVYYGTFENAWTDAQNNSPTTVTLLGNVTVTGNPMLQVNGGNVTFDGGEHILSGPDGLTFSSNLVLRSGTFTAGGAGIASSDGTLLNLLDNSDGTYRAFYKNGQPIRLETNQNSLPAGTYTVKACSHDAAGVTKYMQLDNEQHRKTCLACGYTEAAVNCSYSFSGNIGTCPDCKDALTVSVTGTDGLIYDGSSKEPTATVMRSGTALDASKYTVAYNGNKDAGTNTASVTVTIGSNQGTYTERFSIGRATPAITWNNTSQTVNYTGSAAEITAPTVTLVNGETYNGEISYSYTGASSGAGLPTDAGTYSIKASIAEQGNYTDAETANTMTLTIDRAEGTLTVPENSVSKTFGDREFSLNCSTNGNGKISYKSSDEGVASVSADGNVLITGVGETVITATLAEGTNHTGGASQEITVTVAKASAPAIMDEMRNYTYTNGSNGAATIDVPGKLPKDRGRTEYTVTTADEKGILSDVSVDDEGNLTYTVQGNKEIGNTASITVTVKMANYETAAFTVDIVLVEKKTVEPQTGGSVSISGSNILIYGQTLSDLTLSSVDFVEQETGKKVEGTLAWKNSSSTPVAGTMEAEWIFAPTNSSEYAEMTGTVSVTVAKATPNADTPMAGAVIYNPSGKLDSVTLTGGSTTWTVGGSIVDVEGTWSWKDDSAVPTVGNSGYTAIFTPDDIHNYNTVERTVTVAVEKAEPYIEGLVSAAPITYGDSLSRSALTGTAQYSSSDGTVVPGSFTWKDGTAKPAVSDSGSTKYTVIFTPDEGTNYSSVETEITLVIEKAENAPYMPSGAMNVPRRCEKVNDVELPSGWQWMEADREKELEIDVPLSATAIYVGADKDNYENTEAAITITRSNCDHEKTELKDVVPATCEKEGYSGDIWCTICGELLQKGSVTPVIGHKGGVASCREQAVCEMCGKPYGPYDANRHINTERRNAVQASCTVAGNTGDLYCTACGAKVESGRVIPASGHDWQESVIKQPTISEEGLRRYTCRNCGASREEAIPKLPSEAHTHSYSVTETRAASCTEAGIKVYSCSCGDSYTESTPASGHSYHSQMTKAPTVSEEGVMTYTCTRCGHSYTAAISRLEAPGQIPETGAGNTVKPGIGSTENPGDGTGAAQEGRPDTGIPFIKDADGKTGWDVIRAEEEKTEDGNVINVDMNGSTVVPGDIFDSIKGRDITITFDMGDGILWSVDGKSIITDKAGDIDFSVRTGVSAIPGDIVNNVTGESYSIRISLAYSGEFGFTAVLSINLGKENAGYTASLYYYNESTGELEFIVSDTVAEDGTASLAFTHASDYVIVIDDTAEKEGSDAAQNESEGSGQFRSGAGGSGETVRESPEEVQNRGRNPAGLITAGIIILAGIGAGIFIALKKKKE